MRAAVTRRDLIAWGAAGVASLALPRWAWAANELATANVVDRPMSVGYLDGSEDFASVRRGPWIGGASGPWQAVPAAGLGLGEQRWALETIRMRIHGLYPRMPAGKKGGFGACWLTVWMPQDDPTLPPMLPFYAWGSRRLPAPSNAAPLMFRVPTREDGGLALTLEVLYPGSSTGGAPVLGRYTTDFTVDWQAGRPKLRRGLYLLGFTESTWERPAAVLAPRKKPSDQLCSLLVSFDHPFDE
ncbi:MAG TPA: hypothetical protein VF017_16745 [Thermoanaerobaculia bacterium]|nr:hypothetical protein [Thermoanaerobaculia bacterium]